MGGREQPNKHGGCLEHAAQYNNYHRHLPYNHRHHPTPSPSRYPGNRDSTTPMLTAAAYLPNGYGGDLRLKVLEATILQPKEAPLRIQERNNQHSYGGERQRNNRKNDEDNNDGDSSAHQ